MASRLEEPEFWLPSEFLTDDDVLIGLKEKDNKLNLSFPNEFPYDFALGSLVESFVGSTESDEEDALADLTRQLTHTTLNHHIKKSWVHSGSPQSTLTHIGGGSGHSSSNVSPNGSSPPTTPLGAESNAWDLIYQAAGHVARMKMHGGMGPTRVPPRSGYPVHSSVPLKNPNSCFSVEQARKEETAMQQGSVLLNRGVRSDYGVGGLSGQPFELPKQYRQRQQTGSGHQSGSGNGCIEKKRVCAGTGVFLPRRYSPSPNPTDSRKKPGCTTSWLPTSVMNKNIDGFNVVSSQPRFNTGTFISDYDILVMARRNALVAAQQRQRNVHQPGSLEVLLPHEWTY